MGLVAGEEPACWILEVVDPPPGRSATLILAERPSDDPAEVARCLRDAIMRANRELGDDYVVKSGAWRISDIDWRDSGSQPVR
jgi:hypothetical protein